jgi:RimJ/RimL family protein N-acetyltransferase/acetolactate synthase regulatory subunit
MAESGERRERVLEAAARVYSERSVARAGRRDIAKAADLPGRALSDVGLTRVDLLREVVAELPFPPTARLIADQADNPLEPALQTLLRAARQVLGDPSAAWDPLELQAIAIAPYDEALRAVTGARLDLRRAAAHQVVRRLRGADGADPVDPVDDAAVLHLLAVGLGLAYLSPLAREWSDAAAWTALSARLLESLSGVDVEPVLGPERRWRVRVTMASAPSAMAALLRVLAHLGVHVVSMFTAALADGRRQTDLILASSQDVDRATIAHALSSVATDVIVARGVETDTEDVATRVLQLSARLATDPDAAPRAAADLVLADSWEVTTAAEGEDASAMVLRLQWTPERHVVLRREGAPFTLTERDRASALLGLVAALSEARGEADGFGWRETLRDGETVTVRLARPADAARVQRMHDRAGEQSRFQRYFTPMNEWRQDHLSRISGGHRGATLVVTALDEEVVALGNVFPAGPHETDRAEIAVIVEDAWQGRGIGMLLTRRLIDVARRMGFGELVAYVLAENAAMLGLLAETELDWTPGAEHDLGPTVTALTAAI